MWKNDSHPEKINLGVGAYRDNDGKPVVLEVIREAERRILGRQYMEYLPMGGNKSMVDASVRLAYGADAEPVKSGRIAAIQTLSGTGACRVAGEFFRKFPTDEPKDIYIPNPTWGNHWAIFKNAGMVGKPYKYYKPETRGLDFEGMMADLQAMPQGSIVLMHPCAHNPTGVDPTPEQWQQVSDLVKGKGHFVLFDMAYQGFASGDFEKDAAALKIFLNDGHTFALSQSYAKNMGLYGQRAGCLSVVCEDADEAKRVESQLKITGRTMYSNPPVHAAALVDIVLNDAELQTKWKAEVKGMADRIISMREALRGELEGLGSKHSWSHITDQIGMFAYTGLTTEQVEKLYGKAIYMTRDGRISMAGVNTGNVKRLAQEIHNVTK